MEETFDLVRKSRVNYYTPGSPVQVVCVELLQGSVSKENAVCLSFRNIQDAVLTGLKVYFKCKGVQGEILFEGDFTYDNLEVDTGVVFGMDDAVFVTKETIASIDVSLQAAWYENQDGTQMQDLSPFARVRLPAPKKLPSEVAEQLQTQSDRQELRYMPQVLENGWYCACGAFHSNEENTVYCSECGSDRILLQNAISGIMNQGQPAADQSDEEPTQVMTRSSKAQEQSEEEKTRVVPETKHHNANTRPYAAAQPILEEEDDAADLYDDADADADDEYDDNAYEEEVLDPRDALADKLIRWVPVATAILCTAIAGGGFAYCKLFL